MSTEPETRIERRRFPRVGVDVSVALVMAGRHERIRAQLVDLSEGGCFFATPITQKPGRQVSLVFARPEQKLCVAMGGIVRSVEGTGFGVEFTTVNEPLRTYVGALIRAAEEERRRLVSGIVDGEIHVA